MINRNIILIRQIQINLMLIPELLYKIKFILPQKVMECDIENGDGTDYL